MQEKKPTHDITLLHMAGFSYWVTVQSTKGNSKLTTKHCQSCSNDTPAWAITQQFTGLWHHTAQHSTAHCVLGGQSTTRWLWPCSSFLCLSPINLQIPPSFTPSIYFLPSTSIPCSQRLMWHALSAKNTPLQRGREGDKQSSLWTALCINYLLLILKIKS